METREIILASASPRRKELLDRAGVPFRVIASDADELGDADMPAADIAITNAQRKALDVARHQAADAVVIGADTIVVLDGRIFGKPSDAADARRMLGKLSNRTHQVITGVCIIQDEQVRKFAEVTYVTFKKLEDAEIDAYIATGEPLDKAGAYGIQGTAGAFVDHIEGDFDNVVGLPVRRLQRALDLEGGN